jgi:hypothetical protein
MTDPLSARVAGLVSVLSGCTADDESRCRPAVSASGDHRCYLACDQLKLLLLVVERPEVDALASRVGVA